MLELEEARSRLLARIVPLNVERVPIRQAAFRVSARLVDAGIELPPFDNSAMDGYAVRAADVAAATADSPVTLSLAGKVAAGQGSSDEVGVGQCARVFTGSMLPAGADAVVMQEDTAVSEAVPQAVRVFDPVKPWENVRFRGEDVKRGAVLVRAGERLSPGHLGLLSASGVAAVEVFCQPVIGLLATGSELVEPGGTLLPGRIFESNRALLEPLLARSGATVRVYPLVPDTLAETRDALARAFAECDGVVTSGGVSVGELDFVKAAFEQLGGERDFWKVAIKPGKPFVFGTLGSKRWFGLPGNPVSAMVTFLLLVRPALWRWQGATVVEPRTIPCQLGEPLVNHGGRRHFMRVSVDEKGVARSAGLQASHRLMSLAEADAVVEVPPDTALAAGAMVKAIPLV